MNTFSSLLLCFLFTTLSLLLGNSTGEYAKQDEKMTATVNGFDSVESKGSKINQVRLSDSADSKKSDDAISNKKLQGRKMLVNTRHDAKETIVVNDGSVILDGGSSSSGATHSVVNCENERMNKNNKCSNAEKGTKSIASRNSGTDLLSTNKLSSQDSNANAASSSFEGSHDKPLENFESQKHHQAAGKFMNMMHRDYKGSDGKASSHRRPPINNNVPLDVDNDNELIHIPEADFSTPTMMSNDQILDDYRIPAPKPRRKPPINNRLNP
ncbi:hypothetical protein MKX01_031374 [Papaver californicum]|nr:hypothetical protein MKX01_031374 [Papaver californicum]